MRPFVGGIGDSVELLRDLVLQIDELDGDAFAALPDDTRAELDKLLDDPEAATEPSARSPEARAAIGGYCEGPRIDPLLRFPGAAPVIAAASLAARAGGNSSRSRANTRRPSARRESSDSS